MAKKTRARKTKVAERPLESDVMLARTAADAVVRRAAADPDFRRKLVKNPNRTLRSAGVPVIAIEDVAVEIVIDKSPLRQCSVTCVVTCHVTCFLTGRGRLAAQRVDPA